jgi:hypothetical protein
LIWRALVGLFRSRGALEAEILVLRHQLNVLWRSLSRPNLLASAISIGSVFAGLYWPSPDVLDTLKIRRPEAIVRWHRAGFRSCWRWKSHTPGGRPATPLPFANSFLK